MSLLYKIFQTQNTLTMFITRVVVGIVMFAHGAQKMLGWFGGHGVSWTLEKWSDWFGFHPVITFLVIVGEFMGSILLVIGFAGRLMAVVTGLIMLGAVYFVHFRWVFFMNWYSEQGRGEGFEYHLLMLGMVSVLILNGSGKYSFDRLLTTKWTPEAGSKTSTPTQQLFVSIPPSCLFFPLSLFSAIHTL